MPGRDPELRGSSRKLFCVRRAELFLPLAAFLAIAPLLVGGWGCGVDLPFHLQSWIDASHQFQHGAVYPRWTFEAAYNAGEPRFTFYPPLSWMLGGLLTLVLPIAAVPAAFAWTALTLAGWTIHRLVVPWTSPAVALAAGCVYLANPFMLYTVAMRGACGELLAAAWCPLLLAAMLAEQPSAWRIGVPLGLFWLSNVPGAVIGMYLFALLAVMRLVRGWSEARKKLAPAPLRRLVAMAKTFAGGAAYGLALPAVFLIPALWERHFIQMDAAYPPGMRPFDSLLLQRRLDPVRDAFLLHIEHIALALVGATLLAVALAWMLSRNDTGRLRTLVLRPVLVITAVVSFMLLAPSAVLWKALPALWVTQLPWRILFVQGCCLAMAAGCAFWAMRPAIGAAVVLSFVLVLSMGVSARSFRRVRDASDRPQAILASMQRHHTPEPTDEYVLADADAEFMRPDSPPFWLTSDAGAYAPGTTPNTTSYDPAALMPAVPQKAQLFATPLHFHVMSPSPAFVIVNLQNYPKWRVALNGVAVPALRQRPDGLIAFAVPAGESQIDIVWRHAADEWMGWLVSAGALLAGLFSTRVRSTPAALNSAATPDAAA